MAPSNGTTSTAPCNGTLVPHPIRQSGSSPSPPIGSKNPYSYRYLGKYNRKRQGGILSFAFCFSFRCAFVFFNCFLFCMCLHFFLEETFSNHKQSCLLMWFSTFFPRVFIFLKVFYICRCFLFVCFLVALFHFVFSLLLSHSFWIQLEYNDTVEKTHMTNVKTPPCVTQILEKCIEHPHHGLLEKNRIEKIYQMCVCVCASVACPSAMTSLHSRHTCDGNPK